MAKLEFMASIEKKKLTSKRYLYYVRALKFRRSITKTNINFIFSHPSTLVSYTPCTFIINENKSKVCFDKSRIPWYFAIQTTCLIIGLSDLWLFDMQSAWWLLYNWSWLLTEACQEVCQARKPIKCNIECRTNKKLKCALQSPESCEGVLDKEKNRNFSFSLHYNYYKSVYLS